MPQPREAAPAFPGAAELGVIGAVFAGGALGTAARALIDAAFHPVAPWSTLAINVVGAFVLGLLTASVLPRAARWLRAGIGTGILGGFTTFSAVSVVAAEGLGDPVTLAYLALTLLLGIPAAWLGLALGGMRGRAASATDPGVGE